MRAALHGLVEIDQMAVEVRAVHAGELRLAADGQAAAAAHARAVDHDRVHADTTVFTSYFLVTAQTNFIMTSGPMAMTSSYSLPS